MELVIQTDKTRQVIDITDKVAQLVDKDSKVVHVFVAHTTCAVTTADLDPGAGEDLAEAVWKMIPDLEYSRHHNPSHFPSHIAHSVIGPSLTLPVIDGSLALGSWQRIILLELDGPKRRRILVTNLV